MQLTLTDMALSILSGTKTLHLFICFTPQSEKKSYVVKGLVVILFYEVVFLNILVLLCFFSSHMYDVYV